MAKHNGIIPIKGTAGNMGFLDTKDGLIVRKKSNSDGNRVDEFFPNRVSAITIWNFYFVTAGPEGAFKIVA